MKILTDEEIAEISVKCGLSNIDFARAVEAKIIERIGKPRAYQIEGGKFNERLLHPFEYYLNTDPKLERWKVSCVPLFAIKGVK